MGRFIAFFTVLLLAHIGNIQAQPRWKLLAGNILQTDRNSFDAPAEYGAITVKGSIVLAGWKNLVLSTDLGKTWKTQTLPNVTSFRVMDLDIYDDKTFVAQTAAEGTFLSRDGGLTWQHILSSGDGHAVMFNGAPTKFIISRGLMITTLSIGQPVQEVPMGFNFTIRLAADGSILTIGTDNGELSRSVDGGASWLPVSTVNVGDCYGFLTDKFDPDIIVVVNEDWAYRINGQSELFRTTDRGQTWTIPYSKPLGLETDLKGCSSTGCNDYFVGSINGIIRSADKGKTWTSIGGPPTPVDAKALSALDDSLVFAIDTFGSIWSTDPVSHSSGSGPLLITSDLQADTITICDTIDFGVIFHEACYGSEIQSVEVKSNSNGFQIVKGISGSTLPDSVRVRFAPSMYGLTNASIVITLKGGKTFQKTVTFFVKQLSVTVETPASLADTVSFCDTPSYLIKFSEACNTLKIDSIKIIGSNALDYQIVNGLSASTLPDSIRIQFTPSTVGKTDASLRIKLQDGRLIIKNISVVVRQLPLSVSIPHLQSDTICSTTLDSLLISVPCNFTITDASIRGPDAASFKIAGASTLALPSDSTMIITCDPQHAGKLTATLHLIGQDGSIWDFPLTPYAVSYPQFFFIEKESVSAYTDTIGGDATLRIKLVDASVGGSFIVHYDKDALNFRKATGNAGSDRTIGSTDPTSARIRFYAEDSVINIHFSFFPVDSICTQVVIDSLNGFYKTIQCLAGNELLQTAEICSPPGCGSQMLSRFVRFGTVKLDIEPNPTSGNITVFANQILDNAQVEIIDAFGVIQKTYYDAKLSSSGYTVQTKDLPSGLYHLYVRNAFFAGSSKFLIAK